MFRAEWWLEETDVFLNALHEWLGREEYNKLDLPDGPWTQSPQTDNYIRVGEFDMYGNDMYGKLDSREDDIILAGVKLSWTEKEAED